MWYRWHISPFTYIHNWPLQPPSVRIISLVSYTTYVVCVNFIHKWRDLEFKVDSERQIFLRNFSCQFLLLSKFLPEIWWEEIAEEIFFHISLNRGLTCHKPTHYLLDHYYNTFRILFWCLAWVSTFSNRYCEPAERRVWWTT